MLNKHFSDLGRVLRDRRVEVDLRQALTALLLSLYLTHIVTKGCGPGLSGETQGSRMER